MTRVYLTIDTEYSSGLYQGPDAASRTDNFARSITCETSHGPRGVSYQLEVFNRHGIKAVFFVDPMPALVWGVAAIEDIVRPIVEAGQDVQLHCHAEWLAHADKANPLGGKTGQNIKDFAFDDQCALLTYCRDTLMAAGAPAPVAFRAGNYGANDDTLRALAEIGLHYDTSHCPALPDGACAISLGPDTRDPVHHQGLIEVPVGSIATMGGGQRHAQITALSLGEMLSAIRHARDNGQGQFTLVSHSFELINRSTRKANHIVARRFEQLCKHLAAMEGVTTGDYTANPPLIGATHASPPLLPASPLRTGWRYAEQLASNALYGAL